MKDPVYDVLVAGAGSMGAATAFWLSRNGKRVLALEQFDDVPHENGSHAGQSRIIRKAYFEDPGYIPLLKRAYDNWKELEALTGETIYHPCGLLYGGPPDHDIIRGIKHAADQFQVPLRPMSASSVPEVFNRPEGYEWWLEPEAGFLLPEKCIQLYWQEARKLGAALHTGEKILHWKKTEEGIRVETSKSVYTCRKLILTAGAWTSGLTNEFSLPLTVTRQLIFWAEPELSASLCHPEFPCWLMAAENGKGAWYGFPYLDSAAFPGPRGMKFALHYAGTTTSADAFDRIPHTDEIREATRDAAHYFKPARGTIGAVKTCLYTNTPDENFIIGFLPGYEGEVAIACGFSGHGFKFVSVIGEILAELAVYGKTAWPIGFLGWQRFR